MIYRQSSLLLAIALLVSVISVASDRTSGGPPKPNQPVSLRLIRSGDHELRNVWVEQVAVIDESTIVLVGTKDDAEIIGPSEGAPTGAIVDLGTKKSRQFTNGHSARIESVSVSRGRVLTVSNHRDPVLRVWDLKANKTVAAIELEIVANDDARYYSVAGFHNSDKVAVVVDERVVVFDPAKPDERTVFPCPGEPRRSPWHPIAVSRDDTKIACATLSTSEVIVWDVRTRNGLLSPSLEQKRADTEIRCSVANLTFAPDGVLFACRTGATEVPKGKVEADIPAESRGVVRVEFPTAKATSLAIGHTQSTHCCSIDSTGTWLVTGNASAF